MNAASDQAPIARTFAAANPIEFELHNLDDERVLYTVGDDEHLQSLILELRNDSPQDICLATPDSGIKPLDGNGAAIAWDEWAAGPSLYHFQLVFRPGVLSDRATFYLAHAAHRVAALDTGWDLHHAQDPGDHTDRISLLWLGKTVAAARADRIRHDPQASVVDFNEELSVAGEPMASFAPDALATDSLPKGGVRKFALTRLGAGTGGGGRGTRVHLRYAQLQYANDRGPVPQGSRTLYLNLINHQGRQNIPLHVGFAGSNTILNDGVTPNELELRITNISANDPITFGNHPATCFTVSFDIDEQPWALTRTGEADGIAIEWDGTPKVPLKALDGDGKPIAERVSADSSWLPVVAEQGTRPTWSFSYVGADIRSLAPGQSVSLKLSNIRSSAPSGYTNLYLRYDHIPGYWDGRFTCLIEKAPLVTRQGTSGHGDVGIGTDLDVSKFQGNPVPKLTVDVGTDNQSLGADKKKPAALFQGGNVGIGTHPSRQFQLHVAPESDRAAALFDGGVGIQRIDRLDRNALLVTSDAASESTVKLTNSGKGAALWVSGGDTAIVIESPEGHLKFSGGAETGRNWTAGVGIDDRFKIRSGVAGVVTAVDALLTIDTTGQLQASGRIRDKTGDVMPVGTILAYAGDVAPDGWMLCVDWSCSPFEYPDLFKVIRYRFGSFRHKGIDNFCLPDLRGRFLRGRDAGAKRDPDVISRKQYFAGNATGGATGDAVGSVQADEVGPHRHSLFGPKLSGSRSDRTSHGGNWGVSAGALQLIKDQSPYPDTENKGKESRPKNIYVNFIIKY